MTSNPADLTTALQRSFKQPPKFTYDQHLRHFLHTHNNDISSGLVTTVIGAGLGFYASKVVRACGVMIGVSILGLEALSRLKWATVDWLSVTNEVIVRSSLVTGSSLGPFPWSWSRRGFVAGLLIGFSLENLGRQSVPN